MPKGTKGVPPDNTKIYATIDDGGEALTLSGPLRLLSQLVAGVTVERSISSPSPGACEHDWRFIFVTSQGAVFHCARCLEIARRSLID